MNNNFDFEEAKAEVDFALEILFDYKYKDFILGKRLGTRETEKLQKILYERVLTKRPIQQILGQAYFFGRKFFVDEHTLIPRPETELLVKETLETIKNMNAPKLLDIGTGSGCIPVTIALENNGAVIDSVDISEAALNIAQKNKSFYNISSRINFIKSDLFENVNKRYNVIVSNPPYIPLKDKDKLQIEVKDFEPSLALFAEDEDGVYFYKKIIDKASDYLYDGGFILFELGINQSGIVQNYLKNKGFCNINPIKDFNAKERVIIAEKINCSCFS